MINRILVPVDFSPGAAAALRYAEALARSIGARQVKVIHVFTPQTASADAITVAPVGELMEERDRQFEAFVAANPGPGGIQRRSELLLGFAADKIIEQSADFDLVVLGASGESDLLEEVFGSVASAVAQRAHCSVMLVPVKAHFRELGHILYASNDLSMSRRAVLQLMDFNEAFHARIHFVHVNEDEDTDRGEREKLFAPLFNNPDPEFAFEIVEVTADTVQEGLVEYIRKYPVKLAVMVTKERSFWERLFHVSAVKQMVLHPEVPVLVLHLND